MLKLTINESKRTLKDEFIDVKLFELKAAYQFIGKQSIAVKAWLLNGKDCPEDELIEFKINWVSMFSDFSKDELRLVSFDDLEFCFAHCIKFINAPEVALDLKEFKLNGKTYKLLEPLRTISGAQMLFGNGNYRQWMLSNQLSKAISEKDHTKCIDSLIQLCAVLYTDGDDSNEAMMKRAKEFENLSALYGWSCYFFFALLLKKYSEFFQLSTTPTTLTQAKKKLVLEQSKKRLSTSIIGKLLPSRLLNSEFLILEN